MWVIISSTEKRGREDHYGKEQKLEKNGKEQTE